MNAAPVVVEVAAAANDNTEPAAPTLTVVTGLRAKAGCRGFDVDSRTNKRILALYREGKPHGEIAALVGISMSAVKNRVYEARLAGLVDTAERRRTVRPLSAPVEVEAPVKRGSRERVAWARIRRDLNEQIRREFLAAQYPGFREFTEQERNGNQFDWTVDV